MTISERVDKVTDNVFLAFVRDQDKGVTEVYHNIKKQLAQLAEDVRRESYADGLENGRREV